MNIATQMTVDFCGKVYPVSSIEDARDKWVAFREESGGGVSEIGNGVEIKQGRKTIARISYNGRVWEA